MVQARVLLQVSSSLDRHYTKINTCNNFFLKQFTTLYNIDVEFYKYCFHIIYAALDKNIEQFLFSFKDFLLILKENLLIFFYISLNYYFLYVLIILYRILY